MFSNRSTKFTKRGFSKRRQVVQLDDEPRSQPSYGFGYKPVDDVHKPEVVSNALSGLMSHYAMDSFSDDNSSDQDGDNLDNSASHATEQKSEKKPWPHFVAATDTQLPGFKASENTTKIDESATKDTASSGGEVKDDIDLKLKDFLAEIESLDIQQKPISEDGGLDGKPLDVATDSDADNGVGALEEDVSPPVKPKEPTTVWQHCLDEGTQCYYYWHTETNEVTWEIPPEFSQYLLRYKEFERFMAKYERDFAEWKKTHGSKKPKKSSKKERKHKKKAEEEKEIIEPLVSYPPENIEDLQEETILVYGPQKPPDHILKQLASESEIKQELDDDREKQLLESADDDDESDRSAVISSQIEAPLARAESAGIKQHHHKNVINKDEEVDVSHKLGETSSLDMVVQFHEQKNLLKDHSLPDRCQDHTLKMHTPNDDELHPNVDDGCDIKITNSCTQPLSAQDTSQLLVTDLAVEKLEEEDGFVNQQLEVPVFTHYEYVNQKYTEEPKADADVDIDDIDRELELALEKRQNKAEVGSQHKKRKAETVEEESISDKKRTKTDIDSTDTGSSWRNIIKADIKLKVNELEEVVDLASTIMEKLEFLEVTQNGLSKLQILLVQTDTRLQDWRVGALSTDYLLQRLREASAILLQYEQSASPLGWSCVWDRTYKRYFYSNNMTGETSWAYPGSQEDTDFQSRCNNKDSSAESYVDIMEKSYGNMVTQAATHQSDFAYDRLSTSSSIILLHMNNPLESGEETSVPIPVTRDLLSLAANPPPPPPSSPPPSSSPPSCPPPESPLSSSRQSPENHSVEMDEDADKAIEDCGMTYDSNQDPGIQTKEEMAVYTSEPHLLPGQISAPPMITKSVHSTASLQSFCTASSTDAIASGEIQGSSSIISSEDNLLTVQSLDGIPMEEATSHPMKEKKKKKDKLNLGGSLSMKKKGVTSLVEKWQKIQDDVSKEAAKERRKQQKLAELSGKGSTLNMD